MRQKLLTIATILLLALLAYSQWDRAITYRKERDDYKEKLEQSEAKVKSLRTQVPKVTTKAQTDRLKVKEVLDEAPAFRDIPVPEPVRTGLCSVIRCK